jgi:hypothetical protein
MPDTIPAYVSVLFEITTALTLWFFYKATSKSTLSIVIIFGWLILQAIISLTGFYTVTTSIPPRFLLLALPPVLFIVGLFVTSKGKRYIDTLDAKWLTYLHVVRVPVEIVLFWLFVYKRVPQLMTFEGRNYDILSGITAFVVGYLGYTKQKLSNTFLLFWNFICLGLLFNIVINAVLSAPSPFQKFGFDQPNVAILYFPFVWLPCCIVPLVLFSHLASIRQLLANRKQRASKDFFATKELTAKSKAS